MESSDESRSRSDDVEKVPPEAVEAAVEAPPAAAAEVPLASAADEPWIVGSPGFEWIGPRDIIEPVADVVVRHWPVLLGVSLLVVSAGDVLLGVTARIPGASLATSQATDMLPVLVNAACFVPLLVLFMLLCGAVSVVALAARHGRPLSVLHALGLALSRGSGALFVGGLLGVATALAAAWPVSFANQLVRIPPGIPTPDPSTGLYVYCVAMLLAGAFVAVRLAFSGAAGVLEGRGDAFARSWQMTGPVALSLLVVVLPTALGALAAVGICGSVLRQINLPDGLVDLVSVVVDAAALVLPIVVVTEMYMLVHLRSADYAASPVLELLPGVDGDDNGPVESAGAPPAVCEPETTAAPPLEPDARERAFAAWYEARLGDHGPAGDDVRGAWMEAIDRGQAWTKAATERREADERPTERREADERPTE